MSERRCETCEAWVRRPKPEMEPDCRVGTCHLYPDTTPTLEHDWCMQWTSKAAAQASAQGVEAFARVMAGEGER